MKTWLAIAGAAALATALWWSNGATAPPDDVHEFMKLKLEHSKAIVEGLVLEDHEKIKKHSQDLSLLSLEANWRVIHTPEYLQHSEEFKRTADSLTDAGRKKNIDGAVLAYLEMTMKCVNCHKYVRNRGNAFVEPPAELLRKLADAPQANPASPSSPTEE